MNLKLINLLSQIKVASLNRKENILVDCSAVSLSVVKSLYKEGFIQSFKIIFTSSLVTKQSIIIKLRYYFNVPIFKKLKIISSASKIKVLDFYTVSRLTIKKDVLFLSTNKGLFTLLECKQQKLGGVLFFIC